MKAKPPNKAQAARWALIRALGCIVNGGCWRPAAIHHALTGGGGRKDHDKVLPLCHHHHQGEQGIHTLSRRIWQPIYGYELELLEKVDLMLENQNNY